MMKDSKGRDVQVGDIVFYGERTYNKGGRGSMRCGRITDIASGLAKVDNDYVAMRSKSFVKVSPMFATMWENGTIFEI
ncbi:hypothetical protein KMI11_104 [Klebsiella phage KMI11]|nr:hypothetical protein KMI11_104 [Klebsiella phage KMI11]UJP30331.1 hypothetical protein [Klebsiella phage Kpn6N]UYL05858.1 hypothetical protein MMDGKJEO_00022 [Klebsiella phage KP13MC5-5]CAK6605087.1 unknown function [Klebsiella phage vB_Kte_K65PH164]